MKEVQDLLGNLHDIEVARTMLTERKKVGKLPSVMRQLTKEENDNWVRWHQLRERMRSLAARHSWYQSLQNPSK